jgi:hypothetical protein
MTFSHVLDRQFSVIDGADDATPNTDFLAIGSSEREGHTVVYVFA